MELKDYLHFYMGCSARLFHINKDGSLEYERDGVLVSIRQERESQHGTQFHCETGYYNYRFCEVRPVLRTTQSITNEQWAAAPKGSCHIGTEGVFYAPELFRYLLSLHVDLFGLIPAGLAVAVQSKQPS